MLLEDRVKIKFTRDIGNYKSGEIHDISEENGSALHYLKRGCLQVEEDKVETIVTSSEQKSASKKVKGQKRESVKDIL